MEWGDLDGDCYFPPDGPKLIQSQSCQKSSCNCLFCFIGTPDGCRGYNYEQHLKSVSGAKKAQNADDIRSSDSIPLSVAIFTHVCLLIHLKKTLRPRVLLELSLKLPSQYEKRCTRGQEAFMCHLTRPNAATEFVGKCTSEPQSTHRSTMI